MPKLWPRLIAVAATVAAASPARGGGGFEIDDQSAPSIGMAGAATAVADDPSAIFYNPAGLGFQPGLGVLVGGNLIIARTHVSPDGLTLWHAAVAPTLYAAQRLGRHVAFGIGAFSNYDEHFDYPSGWRGRFLDYFVDITTVTINPTLAIRILPWLAIGGGVDVVPATFEVFRAISFGGGEGNVHVSGTDVGVGGNVGLLLELWPHHLRFGVGYRTSVELEFNGRGAISAPPELRAMTGGLQYSRLSLPLPHNFAIGLAGFAGHLTVSAEVKVSMWKELERLTVTLIDPMAPPGTPPMVESAIINFHNTWAVRVGAQYGFLDDRVRARLGVGYDTSPQPENTLSPLEPDSQRALVSIGAGVRWRSFSVDLGYLAVFLIKTTATNPDLIASYQTFGQVISLSVTGTWTHLLQRAPSSSWGPDE
jgi:long-chain fatty acid transport protein